MLNVVYRKSSSQWYVGLLPGRATRDSSALDPETTGCFASISAGCIKITLPIHDDTSTMKAEMWKKLQGASTVELAQLENAFVYLGLVTIGIQNQ